MQEVFERALRAISQNSIAHDWLAARKIRRDATDDGSSAGRCVICNCCARPDFMTSNRDHAPINGLCCSAAFLACLPYISRLSACHGMDVHARLAATVLFGRLCGLRYSTKHMLKVAINSIQDAATGFVRGTAEYLPFRDAALRPCRLHNDAILLFPSLDCRPGPSTTLDFNHNSA